jgi:protein-tyrosine phosphatase
MAADSSAEMSSAVKRTNAALNAKFDAPRYAEPGEASQGDLSSVTAQEAGASAALEEQAPTVLSKLAKWVSSTAPLHAEKKKRKTILLHRSPYERRKEGVPSFYHPHSSHHQPLQPHPPSLKHQTSHHQGDYEAVGTPVYPSLFIPMKTPMSEEILSNWSLAAPPRHAHTLSLLLATQRAEGRRVGLIIDLANHPCLYADDLKDSGLEYIHMQLVAKVLPPPEAIDEVERVADAFWAVHPDRYIAIHCAYGFNRTGFVVCSYLCQARGLSVHEALRAFAVARPPGVKHAKFVGELYERYGTGEERSHRVSRTASDCDGGGIPASPMGAGASAPASAPGTPSASDDAGAATGAPASTQPLTIAGVVIAAAALEEALPAPQMTGAGSASSTEPRHGQVQKGGSPLQDCRWGSSPSQSNSARAGAGGGISGSSSTAADGLEPWAPQEHAGGATVGIARGSRNDTSQQDFTEAAMQLEGSSKAMRRATSLGLARWVAFFPLFWSRF